MGKNVTSLEKSPHKDTTSSFCGQTLFPAMGLDSLGLLGSREVVTHVGTVEDGTPTTTSTQGGFSGDQGCGTGQG